VVFLAMKMPVLDFRTMNYKSAAAFPTSGLEAA
jgi:hypothetical protein